MANKTRDDFSARTIRTLQDRAGCRCSMPGCGALTIGPSEESPEKSTNLGVASHICAAAPDGPRYDPSMTAAERAHIFNGIWLCVFHSVLIDRDKHSFPVSALHAMKKAHEEAIKLEHRSGNGFLQHADFIAVGPGIVGLGELVGTTGNNWSVRIDHFVVGELSKLIILIESFEKQKHEDRYIIINALGDGRQLATAPSWKKNGTSIELTFAVENRYPRKNAHHLGSTLATNSLNDIFVDNGDLAVVSGINALPQKIRTVLSFIRGESPFYPSAGTRLKEYFDEFENSPWLVHWLKLEVIRQSCIPYHDRVLKNTSTPLECVNKVYDVRPGTHNSENWREFYFELDVEGIGVWKETLSIFVPQGDMPPKPKGWGNLCIE